MKYKIGLTDISVSVKNDNFYQAANIGETESLFYNNLAWNIMGEKSFT